MLFRSWDTPRRSGGDDAHELATPGALLFEFHHTIGLGEKRVIPASPYVDTGENPGTALTTDHAAGLDDLTAEDLHAESFGLGITTVA